MGQNERDRPLLKDGLIEDGEEEAYRYMADVVDLSDAEAEYLGLDMEQYRTATGEDADNRQEVF